MDLLSSSIDFFNDNLATTTEQLSASPRDFSEGLFNMVKLVNEALTPLAIGLLITYFIFSFYEHAVTFKMNDYKIFGTHIIKLTLGIIILLNNLVILELFYYVGSTVLNRVQIGDGSALLLDSEEILGLFGEVNLFLDILKALEIFFSQLALIITLNLVNFVISWAVLSRMFEIYIYLAFGPIAMCSFVNDMTRGIFKSYITNFCVVVLKGAVIVFTIQMYQTYVADTATIGENVFTSVFMSSFLLVALITTSEKLSRTIVGSLK